MQILSTGKTKWKLESNRERRERRPDINQRKLVHTHQDDVEAMPVSHRLLVRALSSWSRACSGIWRSLRVAPCQSDEPAGDWACPSTTDLLIVEAFGYTFSFHSSSKVFPEKGMVGNAVLVLTVNAIQTQHGLPLVHLAPTNIYLTHKQRWWHIHVMDSDIPILP